MDEENAQVDLRDIPLEVFITATPDKQVYIRLTFQTDPVQTFGFTMDGPAAFKFATGIMIATAETEDLSGFSGAILDMEPQA